MDVAKAVDVIRKVQDHPPTNEADTCNWVILPALYELGYDPPDVSSQCTDAAGTKPDYRVLDGPACWFLEAKAWNLALTDQHAAQATSYAYNDGKRWAVLSNGRTWRLYDAHIQGEPQGRLIREASIDDEDDGRALAELFEAIRKEAMVSGKTELFAKQTKLQSALRRHLADEKSAVIGAIVWALKKDPDLKATHITRADVVSYFAPPLPPTQPEDDDQPGPSAGTPPQPEELHSIASVEPKYKKVAALLLPDQPEQAVKSWIQAKRQVLRWLASQEKLPPLPFPVGWRYFILNSEPHDGRREMLSPERLDTPGGPVYYDANFSAQSIVKHMRCIFQAVGIDPNEVKVRLRP
jgi:hypothetical protein